jgi:hypothetical protein
VPTLGFHVPDEPGLKEKVEDHAKERGFQSVSAYAWDLVSADMRGELRASASSPTILEELAQRLLGDMAKADIQRIMLGRDQRAELRALIDLLIVSNTEKAPPLSAKIDVRRITKQTPPAHRETGTGR